MLNISSLLVWFVIGTWAILLFSIWREKNSQSRGWFPIAITGMALTLILFFTVPTYAGYIALAFTLLFGYLPAQGLRRISLLSTQGKYDEALQISKWVRLLHPAGNWTERDTWLDIYQHTRQGNHPLVHQRLAPLIQSGDHRAITYSYILQNQWAELAHWIKTNIPPDTFATDPALLTQYLRALGESGQPHALLSAHQQHQPALAHHPHQQQFTDMFTLAFCGRPTALANLLEKQFTFLPPHTRQLWLATAHLANGHNEIAHTQLQPLTAINDTQLQHTLQRRFNSIPTTPITLSPAEQSQLDSIEQNITHRQSLPISQTETAPTRRARATYTLIALNVLVFLVEIALGGSENPRTLLSLGALYPPAVLAGQWWRVVASTFLHAGWLHLALNMFALYGLGPFLENYWGKLRYTLLYLVAGIGASTLTVLLTALGLLDPETFYVGASGSVMGLIGATGAVYWRLWRREKLATASTRFATIVIIVALQTIFDLTTPEISFIGHALGLTIGLLLGLRFT